jgi:hypothetical protein
MTSMTPPSKRQRTSPPTADRDTPGTLVVFSDPPVTVDIGHANTTQVKLGGRLWEVQVDEEDRYVLRLSVTTVSDDSKEALRARLAARSHEALQRENEAQALGEDIERLMQRAREVCYVLVNILQALCVCMSTCVCVSL